MPLFVGLMSGTSMDAVDAALVEIDERPPRLIAARAEAVAEPLRRALLALASGADDRLDGLARLDVQMGELFARAALELLRGAGVHPAAVRAIGSHGQTVRHHPDGDTRYSVQIGDPNVIAERTGITTVADFRRRDLAAGGQGAPLVPAFHAAVLGDALIPRTVVNIGGISNLTILPADDEIPVSGFDCGPGNTLLDAWARRHLDAPMDTDGRWAARGRVDSRLLERLRRDPYFAAAPPKSTGPEHFHLHWLQEALAGSDTPPAPADVQRTLCRLTALCISEAVERYAPHTREVLICGGGVHNPMLVRGLEELLPGMRVQSTAAHGIDPDWVEATAFAWLAGRTLDGVPGNLPAVTGASHPVVLGGVYRGGRGEPAT